MTLPCPVDGTERPPPEEETCCRRGMLIIFSPMTLLMKRRALVAMRLFRRYLTQRRDWAV